ncbi:MAG: hypothetical protein JWL93_2928 [Hyphomicrobiales bacterium]|nr:hypothetical protein [Hyphomicrobiales bacterium]
MNPFRRSSPREGEILWLSPAPIRRRRSKFPGLIILVAPLALIAVLAIVIVDMAPKSGSRTTRQAAGESETVATIPPRIQAQQSQPLVAAPAPAVRDVRTTPSAPTDSPPRGPAASASSTPPTVVPSIATPLAPIPQRSEPQQTASLFETPVDSGSSMNSSASDAATSTVPQSPPTTDGSAARTGAPVDLTGAFPTSTPAGTDTVDGQDYAVYFDEAAPDEQEARNLLGEVQRKYGAQLAGGRLTYRRVRVGDATLYRVRMSGMSQARASELCASLKANGGGCEVGPR